MANSNSTPISYNARNVTHGIIGKYDYLFIGNKVKGSDPYLMVGKLKIRVVASNDPAFKNKVPLIKELIDREFIDYDINEIEM